MRITSLDITDLRIIKRLRIEPSAGVNFIVGDNGAGKTSVLEAIYLAGRGRTFRHVDAGPMIRQGAESTTVIVGIRDEAAGRDSILGIRREKRALVCRLDGKDIRKRSILAEALPVQWIGSQPQLFLGMGPEVRRRFIDMGLFHVEHSFLGALTEFQRTLRQRNAAIRTGSMEQLRLWNRPFGEAGLAMHEYRTAFVDELMRRVIGLIDDWAPGYQLAYRYRCGWNKEHSLADQLERKMETDLRLGYTARGPQRAELEILTNGALAEKKLSRGQQKVVVLALNLALADLVKSRKGAMPVILIDDLPAELDPINRERMMHELQQRGGQVFLTKIEIGMLNAIGSGARTFHVEHGALK